MKKVLAVVGTAVLFAVIAAAQSTSLQRSVAAAKAVKYWTSSEGR